MQSTKVGTYGRNKGHYLFLSLARALLDSIPISTLFRRSAALITSSIMRAFMHDGADRQPRPRSPRGGVFAYHTHEETLRTRDQADRDSLPAVRNRSPSIGHGGDLTIFFRHYRCRIREPEAREFGRFTLSRLHLFRSLRPHFIASLLSSKSSIACGIYAFFAKSDGTRGNQCSVSSS